MTRLLIGGYTPDKGTGTGITVVEDGEVASIVPAESPSWIARHPSLPVLYAVAEADKGAVHAWSLLDGVPAAPLGAGDTGGADPCHLTVDPTGEFLVTVNYTGGSVSVHRLDADGAIGARTDLLRHTRGGDHPRQTAAHPHMVRADGGSLFVSDLGGDSVYRYRLDGDGQLRDQAAVHIEHGAGPRHFLRLGDRWLLAAELRGRVYVLDPEWRLIGSVPTSRSAEENLLSELAVSADGRYLYVANRGPDTVTVFALGGDLPNYVTEVPTARWPRHIALDGETMYVAAQLADEVTTMRVDAATGVPETVDRVAVPSPTCVLP